MSTDLAIILSLTEEPLIMTPGQDRTEPIDVDVDENEGSDEPIDVEFTVNAEVDELIAASIDFVSLMKQGKKLEAMQKAYPRLRDATEAFTE